MAFDYGDRSLALLRAQERTQATLSDAAIAEIGHKLDDSAAAPLGYRPLYAAALWLWQNRGDQTIKRADGAEFTNMNPVIEGLLLEQRSIDLSKGWAVLAGFTADELLERVCSCGAPPASVPPNRAIASVTVI